jgi:pre-mRNA-splicing factor ATP-dependent RNA helicase DHX16
MGKKKGLQTWCSDALHDVLGFADTSLSVFLVDVAEKASSYQEILDVLDEGSYGKGKIDRVEQFARDLFRRCHSSGGESKKKGEVKRKPLSPPKDDNDEDGSSQSKLRVEADQSEGNKGRQGEVHDNEKDRGQQPTRIPPKEEQKGKPNDDEETGEGSIPVNKLREQSRQVYLKSREERELNLLQKSLADEATLFKDAKLTKAEETRIALGKRILSMVEEREGKDGMQDGYALPDEYHDKESKAQQDQAKLKSRYAEDKHEKTEQQLWEESQQSKATKQNRKAKNREEQQYDLVFEDKIDFVMQGVRNGHDNRKDKGRKSSSKGTLPRKDDAETEVEVRAEKSSDEDQLTEHQKILACRKRLPVYPYREEFLAAVKDHRVLILVGETGSGKTTQVSPSQVKFFVIIRYAYFVHLSRILLPLARKIPQYLHEVGYSKLGKIACTQPRRVAAMSVASRVAQEMNVTLGHEVGYSIRFETCTSPKTLIQVGHGMAPIAFRC